MLALRRRPWTYFVNWPATKSIEPVTQDASSEATTESPIALFVGSRPIDESPLGQSRQVAGGSEGPLRTLHSFLLGDLILHQEQAGGKEPAGTPVAAEGNRKDNGASGGHDLPAFDNLTTLKTWADEGPPKARSTTTRIPTTTRSYRSPRSRPRPRSQCRSIPRAS